MSDLVIFEQRRTALTFSDYLRLIGIACRVEERHIEGHIGHAVVLADSAQQPQAAVELQQFLNRPEDPRYSRASWATGDVEQQVQASGPGFLDLLKRRVAEAGPVTKGMVVLCVLIYLGEIYNQDAVFNALKFPEGMRPDQVQGQWWRLLTPVILHFSIMHIVFNLLWWWILAAIIERTQSSLHLLGLTLLIALISNIGQFESYGSGFGGLSAVVYGLLGYLWLYPKVNPAIGFQLNHGIVWFMVGYLLIGYTGVLDLLAGGKVSNNGHAVGLVVGCLLGLAFGLLNRGKPARQQP